MADCGPACLGQSPVDRIELTELCLRPRPSTGKGAIVGLSGPPTATAQHASKPHLFSEKDGLDIRCFGQVFNHRLWLVSHGMDVARANDKRTSSHKICSIEPERSIYIYIYSAGLKNVDCKRYHHKLQCTRRECPGQTAAKTDSVAALCQTGMVVLKTSLPVPACGSAAGTGSEAVSPQAVSRHCQVP